jgi:hypothetical protein
MVINMIGRCAECGKRRKLYYAVGSTINALWCGQCIAARREAIETVYEIPEKPTFPFLAKQNNKTVIW